MKTFLWWAARRCDVHDVPNAGKIAELEVATGIDPQAEERRQAEPLLNQFYDPDIVDCGRQWCRKRLWLV